MLGIFLLLVVVAFTFALAIAFVRRARRGPFLVPDHRRRSGPGHDRSVSRLTLEPQAAGLFLGPAHDFQPFVPAHSSVAVAVGPVPLLLLLYVTERHLSKFDLRGVQNAAVSLLCGDRVQNDNRPRRWVRAELFFVLVVVFADVPPPLLLRQEEDPPSPAAMSDHPADALDAQSHARHGRAAAERDYGDDSCEGQRRLLELAATSSVLLLCIYEYGL